MASALLTLPGEEIPAHLLPTSRKGTLTLGPHLRHVPPTTILSTTAGSLHTDHKKSALWLDHSHARYLPAVGDLVIAQIHHSSTDFYYCTLTAHTPHVSLGHLNFEGASKKTRPQLKSGDLVYARVSSVNKWEETEIECVNSNTAKAEGMGPLTGGMLFDVSPAFARRLMLGSKKGGVLVLDEVGEKVKFEVAVGRNGRVWVDSASVRETATIGRVLKESDTRGLDAEQQQAEVKRALKELFG